MKNTLTLNAFSDYLIRSRAVLVVISVATVCMVMVASRRLHIFSELYQNALLWHLAVPFAVVALLYGVKSALAVFSWQGCRRWFWPCIAYLLVALPLVTLGGNNVNLESYYRQAALHWPQYLATTALYMLAWEYFFRGFLIQVTRETLGEGAILVQMVPFTLLHLGKPDIEVISCILSGVVWGYICYHARSFWPAFLMHMGVNLFTMAWFNFASF